MSSPTLLTVSCLAILAAVQGYNHFQLEIPNGEIVPHPCKANYLWRGVGHENHLGGGDRNPFGLDFFAEGKKWTEDLCRLDSDGDGKTNGEELGDPNCTWTKGTKAHTSLGLSHPGVCEPLGSPVCRETKQGFVDCTHLGFECDAIEEEGAFNFKVRMPETPVPAEVTTYMCMAFEFPTGTEEGYHSIATTPFIDNEDIMHHMAVLGCIRDLNVELNKPYPCGMASRTTCPDIIGIWTVGSAGQCFNKAAGFLVGGTTGFKYALLQSHWNNPAMRADYTDSSGITFYLTSRLRPHNAGTLVAGQYVLDIPPGRPSHVEQGRCSSKCTSRDLVENITITAVFNHMHYLGQAQFTRIQRRNGDSVDIAMDEVYSYDSPVQHVHPEGVRVSPGDEISTMCVYKSTSRTTTTFQGEGTHEEMCYSFINFYPRENLRNKVCISALSIDQCDVRTGFVNGCNYTAVNNLRDPKTAKITADVLEYCTPGICRAECRAYVRELRKDPCWQGDIAQLRRRFSYRRNPESSLWYAALDSCDAELMEDSCMPTSGGVKLGPALVFITCVWVLALVASNTVVLM